MELLFEKSVAGRRTHYLPELDVPEAKALSAQYLREEKLDLPELSEIDVDRHYSELERRTYGVNNGVYMLGSCTMKYNPQLNEITSGLPGFTQAHPLAPEAHVQGSLEVFAKLESLLCDITGMDEMTFQPAAGAHGELTGLMMIKAYHESRGETQRTKILIPNAAHGTNPASMAMVGYELLPIPVDEDGFIKVDELRKITDDTVAGLMLTNPNTEGQFEKNISEVSKIVHEAGGLNYYDGANLNAIMGIVQPGKMGFDVIHLNLHKTFSTPHGGGGPGACGVGVKDILKDFLPTPHVVERNGSFEWNTPEKSIGNIVAFHGNFLNLVRAMSYVLMLGRDGIKRSAQNAVLNANYLRYHLKDTYTMSHDEICMHEFVMSLKQLKAETGVSALDIAKGLLDYGVHPPTMYFPLTIPEALMVEPTETESRQTLDTIIKAFKELHDLSCSDPEKLHNAPYTTVVRRPDEVEAARNPILKYEKSNAVEE
ncbi:MAG: aminomethyl-transferring glycine dehydrogenase subunit GcvPB [Coriobacteriia bacterium]|nr:aminomethyl-transferring glycine dehydrogenase subunit GcvPB [Coriobacteriia bacterium]